MINIKLEVPKSLTDALQMKGLDKLVKELALAVRSKMIASTPVDTGTAKRSWSPVKRESGGLSFSGGMGDGPVARRSVGYSFGNTAPYSHILETGSTPGKKPWPSVGPRTVLESGKIYSSQAPGGMLQTAEIEQYIKSALPGLVEKYLK
jgi:hypothetical protein